MKFFVPAFLAVSLTLSVCAETTPSPSGKAVQFDGVAAYVNNEVITIDDVMREVRRSVDFGKVPEAERANVLREAYARMLDLMIDRKLMLKHYSESKMQLQPKALENHIRDIVAANFDGDEAKLEAALQQEGITKAQWQKITEENLIIMLLRHTQIDSKLNISPSEIRKYYKEHSDEFQKKGGAEISMILIPAADGEEATQKALDELKSGVSFAEVAKKYSKDSHAKEGGSWGMVDPEEMFSAPIVNALAKLKPGEYSEVVTFADQNYILYKGKEMAQEELSLREAWSLVEARLREIRYQERAREWLDGLRAEAFLKINTFGQ